MTGEYLNIVTYPKYPCYLNKFRSFVNSEKYYDYEKKLIVWYVSSICFNLEIFFC